MAALPRSARIKTVQYTALALLVLSGVVNYIDRATLAVANPLISHDLGFSPAEMGLLLSAFLWAYAFAQLPAGALVDRLGPRLMLALSLGLWSLAQVAGGLVQNFTQFFGIRMVLGLGEAPQFPTSARIVRDWFNVRLRGTATGIWNCSSTLGTALSAPILTFLMLTFGWRWMFAIMGLFGLVVAVAFYALHRNPNEVALTEEERQYLTEGDTAPQGASVTWAEWKRLFGFRTTWGMIFGFFGVIYVTWVYNSWLPVYLEQDRHLSIASTGIVAAIPFLCGVVGSILGGRLNDWLVTRGMAPMNSRKYPMAGAMVATAGFTTLAALTPNLTVAVIAISISLFLLYVASTSAWAMAPVAAPAHCTASLGAVQNFGGYIGGALAPMVTGFILQGTGSFTAALLVGAAVALVAAVGYVIIVRDPIPAAAEDDIAGLPAAAV
ncbi:sugar phosphate permease [Inquilinus ginsengisoli]|uniref:Sugar phosphate permease n=1 Tax=Inquilinus ginsengisoli TaxID=363840 RepID=A0ABU1JLR8_9PROT|nr:MFS transporter [Inquilinus ginsengisoli]MDR6289283.1 sugar phosphate permease [Inquilinus ginsengisoli]